MSVYFDDDEEYNINNGYELIFWHARIQLLESDSIIIFTNLILHRLSYESLQKYNVKIINRIAPK